MEMKKVEMYKELHKMNPTYGGGGLFLLPAISALIEFLQPKSILDYGCGKGGLVKALAKKYPKIKVYGYDPAIEEFSKMPVKKVDLVINTDVLEHIPEDELPETVQRIASLSQNVFFHLHHGKAIFTLPNGENAHCTIWTPQQYAELFRKYFPKINFLQGYSSINTTCLTFDLPESVKAKWGNLIIGLAEDSINDLPVFMDIIDKNKENIILTVPLNDEYQTLFNYLKYSLKIDRICCVATAVDVEDSLEVFVNECPVVPVDFLLHFRDTAIIFVMLPTQYREVTKKLLHKIGFNRVVIIGDNVLAQCKNEMQKIVSSGFKLDFFIKEVTHTLRTLELKIEEQQEICTTNTAAFADYRNCFRGKKIVIVGSGPTAKYYQPLSDAIHIALNFSWRREDIPFDFLFTGDGRTNKTSEIKMQEGFEKIRDKVFISKYVESSSNSALAFCEDFTMMDKVKRFYFAISAYGKPIYQNIALHPVFASVSISEAALMFALFTYPQEIYLVGCDTSNDGYFYKNENPEHTVGNSNMDTCKMKVSYARLKIFAQRYYPDTKIISVNPVGLRGLFEDVYTKSFVNALKG